MKQILTGALGGLVLVGATGLALANAPDTGGNPYEVISSRNVFDLKPIPPPPDVTAAQQAAPPPGTITLQGITEMFGRRQALLKLLDPPKPGTKPSEVSMILYEGERRGTVEVLAIDMTAKTVKINNSGFVTNMTLADFIPKTPVAAAPQPGTLPRPGMPNMPGVPRPPVPTLTPPGVTPGMNTPTFSPGTSLPGMPQRQVRTSNPGLPTAMVGLPTGVNQPQAQQEPQVQLTPEQQIIMMEVERERTKEAVAGGNLPPLPPTPLSRSAPPTLPQ